MREPPGSTGLDTARAPVVLPAEGATLATSLSRGLVLVAHTGRAHLGIPVHRALLRDVARARVALPADPPARDPDPPAPVDRPWAIPFRHAGSHTFSTDGGMHLTLHATGDRGKPDVHVELRMDHTLLEALAQHRRLRQRRDRVLVLVWFLALAAVLLAMAVFVA